MTQYGFITLVVAITIVLISIIIGVVAYILVTDKRDHELDLANIQNDTKRLELYSNFDFDKIDSRISKYIEDAGNQYRMENFEFVSPDELYLTEDIMNDMIKAMTKAVIKRITPAVLMLLQLSYNVKDEQELVLFLYERIKMYVFDYSLQVNDEIDD